jgi:hypothetical protein
VMIELEVETTAMHVRYVVLEAYCHQFGSFWIS